MAAVRTQSPIAHLKVACADLRRQAAEGAAQLRGELANLRGEIEAVRGQAQADAQALGSSMDTLAAAVEGKAEAQDLARLEQAAASASSLESLAAEARGEAATRAEAQGRAKAAAAAAERRLRDLAARQEAAAQHTGEALAALSSTFDDTIASLRAEADAARRSADSLAAQQQRVAEQLQRLSSARTTDVAEVYQALDGKADVAYVDSATSALTSGRLLEQVVEAVQAEMQAELAGKADQAAVEAQLQSKAAVEDVNAALLEVSRELEAKAPSAELVRVIKMQQARAAPVDAGTGRWVWQSGRTRSGGAVPWNVCTLNTDPDNFIYEKDKVSIMVVVPGLYQVSFGFYSRRKPTVSLLVNGEPVLSAVNTGSYVTHHSSARLTAVDGHPAGNITGVTMIDFLALPPEACLTLTYQSEMKGQGFLSLCKL